MDRRLYLISLLQDLCAPAGGALSSRGQPGSWAAPAEPTGAADKEPRRREYREKRPGAEPRTEAADRGGFNSPFGAFFSRRTGANDQRWREVFAASAGAVTRRHRISGKLTLAAYAAKIIRMRVLGLYFTHVYCFRAWKTINVVFGSRSLLLKKSKADAQMDIWLILSKVVGWN